MNRSNVKILDIFLRLQGYCSSFVWPTWSDINQLLLVPLWPCVVCGMLFTTPSNSATVYDQYTIPHVQSLYFPSFTPCNVFLLKKVKPHLKEKTFQNFEEIQVNEMRQLRHSRKKYPVWFHQRSFSFDNTSPDIFFYQTSYNSVIILRRHVLLLFDRNIFQCNHGTIIVNMWSN